VRLDELITKCKGKPFWRWDLPDKQHFQLAAQTGNTCCFNHLIGLPEKDGKPMPLFDYEKRIYDALQQTKYVFTKKATGLGVTEFLLRYMAWLALKGDSDFTDGTIFTIVTGPRIDLAIDLIERLKRLFEGIVFDEKNTVIVLGKVKIEAFPSHHLDAMRGLTDVKFLFIDEGDFFPRGQSEIARDVAERYIAKSDPHIVMVSTPNLPGGLFEKMEAEEPSIYRKLYLPYTVGVNKIYSEKDIEEAKKSPSFEREYDLKYGYGIGNLFQPDAIEAAILQGAGDPPMDATGNPDIHSEGVVRAMGVDPGFGSSKFAICITEVINSRVRVVYAKEFERPSFTFMADIIWDLYSQYNPTNIYVDASAPELIDHIKSLLNDSPVNKDVPASRWAYVMKVVPVLFRREESMAMLQQLKSFVDNGWLAVHPSFTELVQQMRIARTRPDGNLEKSQHPMDSIDALRLSLKHFEPNA
jgi:hypothetical protein